MYLSQEKFEFGEEALDKTTCLVELGVALSLLFSICIDPRVTIQHGSYPGVSTGS
jgi:hypothetical protein